MNVVCFERKKMATVITFATRRVSKSSVKVVRWSSEKRVGDTEGLEEFESLSTVLFRYETKERGAGASSECQISV